ncbi:MAG: preprotein translocase subunit SecA, partial [Bdellovibrionales bacterium]|nr:preprotein translocase subunit SecA [Bdellovibrionales bacterium]
FLEIYKLGVVVIPTNKPLLRDDQTDVVFRTRKEKYNAAVEDIVELHESGQPVLVGTISIEQSEALSRHLRDRGVEHNVLNAKHHEREADIVAQAGRFGSVTIATNMAGRGTDIMLGGNPESLAAQEVGTKDPESEAFQEAFARCKKQCEEEKHRVLEVGGLFIMGTERHESRRIDNQLRGRAGRQGDPGVTRFYISLEDDLMARFGGERMQAIMSRMGWEEGVAIDGKLISRSIENAQRKVEGHHFEARKHVTEYDDVMNKQRQVIYNMRGRILHNEDIRQEVRDANDDLLEASIVAVCDESQKAMDWDLEKIKARFEYLYNAPLELPSDIELTQQKLFDFLREASWEIYTARVEARNVKLKGLEELPVDVRISQDENKPFEFSTIEQDTFLEALDHHWNQHLLEMDHLREGIGLRGYGQKNPKHEYQREGFLLFQQMLDTLKESVVRKLYYYEIPEPAELMAHIEAEARRRAEMEKHMQMVHESSDQDEEHEEQKDPDEQRAKLQAQRRKRRKKK